MTEAIRNEAELEGCLGRKPGAMDLKVIDHLDEGAARWIGAAPLAALSLGGGGALGMTLAGGRCGFADIVDSARMRFRLSDLDDPALPRAGLGFGALFTVPGIGETLRVNGIVTAAAAGEALVEVKECFMHCAKAFIRSDFWGAEPVSRMPGDIRSFAAATRLLFLGTVNAAGAADVSPKGDPAGLLVRFDGDEAWFAERPGNRRADSFRNLLAQPRLAAVLLVPGSNRIATMAGEAEITCRPDIRQLFAVHGKVPQIATRLAAPCLTLHESPALERAQLWPVRRAANLDPAAIMAGHVRLSRIRGLQATLARTVVSVPGLMKRGLASDYKRNLY